MKKALQVGLSVASLLASAQATEFIKEVNPYVEFRPRYEFVEDKNNTLKNANSLTLKSVIGAKLDNLFEIKGLNGYIEATNVSAIIDKYSPENSSYDLVADPNNTRITQSYVSYTLNKTTFIIGRKFVVIDDHRFIGNVIWRQMPQSFGIVAISDETIKNTKILIAGIYERLGIIDSLNRKWKISKAPIIFDINYKPTDWLKIKGFAYLITDVHNTYGIKTSGKRKYDSFSISYILEYAKQTKPYKIDNASTKPDIDTDYWRISINSNAKGFTLGAEYTHFGDKNGKDKGFSTPLSTLHKFDGWSDVLLTGGAKGFDNGLDEYVVSIGYKSKGFGNFRASYFMFNSSKGQNKNIGTEVDLIYTKKFSKRFNFLVKSAFFKGKNGYVSAGNIIGKEDVNKFWIQLDYKFN